MSNPDRVAIIECITSMIHDADNDRIILTAREGDGTVLSQLVDAIVAAVAPTEAAAMAATVPAEMYVEARQCYQCQHIGINDSSDTDSACNRCDWTGPNPGKDHCPSCDDDGTMTSACPECGGRYEFLCDAHFPTKAPVAGQPAEPSPADPIRGLLQAHEDLIEQGENYAYFELAYTRQTGWMAWLTDRPARGEPGTAEYAKSRKVIAQGQGDSAEEACQDALDVMATPKGDSNG